MREAVDLHPQSEDSGSLSLSHIGLSILLPEHPDGLVLLLIGDARDGDTEADVFGEGKPQIFAVTVHGSGVVDLAKGSDDEIGVVMVGIDERVLFTKILALCIEADCEIDVVVGFHLAFRVITSHNDGVVLAQMLLNPLKVALYLRLFLVVSVPTFIS
jgi:hypothetical protein